MNFFKRQDQARRQTALLVFYLLVAVVLIVVAVNAVIYAAVVTSGALPADFSRWMTLPWWPLVSLVTVLVILGGSLVRYLRLRGGGRAVAELMGARRLDTNTREPMERRFINVVEEMSIASGTPVPDLYVMDQEDGINAFVAGYTPTQAVMVTTRGALESLSRDELQGVVGHEFSHILNGDMRLNVRLMAILAGVLPLGVIGRLMMRSLYGSSRYGRASGGSRSGKGQGLFFAAGLGLFLIGYIGLFFGRLIKAAVSRQREFLADASSVQFTRHPSGIAGALWKIKQHATGSLLSSDRAEETSHMCFGQNMRIGFGNLLATHPSLDERIKRIDPRFHAKTAARGFKEASPGAGAAVPGGGMAVGFAGTGGDAAPAEAVRVVESVGNPSGAHVAYAERLFGAIPATVLESVHDPATAPAVIYGLLLGDVAEERIRLARALIEHETTPDTEARIANARAMGSFTSIGLSPADEAYCKLGAINEVLKKLAALSPLLKGPLLSACADCVLHDGTITTAEAELLRAVSEALDCRYAALACGGAAQRAAGRVRNAS